MIIIRLLDIREKTNLLQIDVAKKLDVSQANYSRWETGTEFIPLQKLNMFCNIFNVIMDYVLGLSRDHKPTKKIEEISPKVVGNNLQTFRKMKNMTQKDLANFLNTSQSNISYYENGRNIILTSFAYQIADKYHISIDWLVGRS